MKRIAAIIISTIVSLPLLTSLGFAQTAVRVATWNLESVGSPGSDQYEATLDVLDRVCADVVGVNEVNGADDVEHFKTLARDAGYPHIMVPDDKPPFGSMRNAFMSRYPISEGLVYTSDTLSGDEQANDMTRRPVGVVVDVPGDARPLTLIVEHWKSGTDNDDEFRRAIESFRISQALSNLDPTNSAYVVMGDVNEEADSVPRSPNDFTYEPSGLPSSFDLGLDLEDMMANEAIYNDPFFFLQDEAGPALTPLDSRQLDGHDGTRPSSGRRLDYIFVSPTLLDFAPKSLVYDSSDDGMESELFMCGSPLSASTSTRASDHFLVFADLTVPSFCSDGSGVDTDLDGIMDGCDNCPSVANPDQTDSNGNGIGNACEPTSDDSCAMLPSSTTSSSARALSLLMLLIISAFCNTVRKKTD